MVTYSETSDMSVMASSPCPMPLVSTISRSKPTDLQTSMDLPIAFDSSLPLSLLANDLMKVPSFLSEFIRILSPSRAPPVLFLVGSVAKSAILVSGLSLIILSTNSSVRLDLPAPPVPVSPITGQIPSSSAVALWRFDPWFSA